MKTPEPATTVWDALAAKYSLPYFILLREVRNATGFNSTRAADAIAVGLYVSRGQVLEGFEVKHNRADWLSELRRPEKAEAIAKFCDHFWLVTADDQLAKLAEIPEPWGWMALRGSRLKVMKKAERLHTVPVDRVMFAALVMAVKDKYLAAGAAQIDELVAARVKEEHSGLQFRMEEAQKSRDALRDVVQEFNSASGLYIHAGMERVPEIGDAVRRVLRDDHIFTQYKKELTWTLAATERIANNIRDEIAKIPDVPAAPAAEETPA
jgi:hypothetical protein